MQPTLVQSLVPPMVPPSPSEVISQHRTNSKFLSITGNTFSKCFIWTPKVFKELAFQLLPTYSFGIY